MIVCSPLNSPATNRIIDQYKHYQHTKILLIDIIGNVFNFENRLYKNLDARERNDLLVLTVLTPKFKHILNTKYQLEFSRYLNLRSLPSARNETSSDPFCDVVMHNSSYYSNHSETCLREIKERCSNYTNEEIMSFCMSISRRKHDEEDKRRLNDIAFNKQLVFSEHFNLFDFITSMSRDEKNASNQERHHQFDFIVLDFKSILNASNESIAFWRPLMILEQNKLDRNNFTMHRASSDLDVFENWRKHMSLWKCSMLCWGIIAGIILILISLISIISLSAGIAAR